MQKDQHEPTPQQPKLSDVWRELLGHSTGEAASTPSSSPEEASPEGETIPTLESDPWNELTQAKGTEVVDVEAIHLGVDDQDVEQALQVMQEHSVPPADKADKKDDGQH
ncbi:MAG TPA: hypothetical protein VH593_22915 [Ktedonobacteraceae bacterium]|jgi:hypothetical protein